MGYYERPALSLHRGNPQPMVQQGQRTRRLQAKASNRKPNEKPKHGSIVLPAWPRETHIGTTIFQETIDPHGAYGSEKRLPPGRCRTAVPTEKQLDHASRHAASLPRSRGGSDRRGRQPTSTAPMLDQMRS